jgi:serine/threonine protein kinase
MDVVVRVLIVSGEGQNHLDVVRKLATVPLSLQSSNHVLPLLDCIQFQDITFGVFPMAESTMIYSYGYTFRNSVGDVINMILQALEALAFIHSHGIAHRDAFTDNFLVQWHPESLIKVSPSLPRVYLSDLETAFDYASPYSPDDPLSRMPYRNMSNYGRPRAPEMVASGNFDPYKLDIWQFGFSLREFKVSGPPLFVVECLYVSPRVAFRLLISI